MSGLTDPVYLTGLLMTLVSVALFTIAGAALLVPPLQRKLAELESKNVDRLTDLFLSTERARWLAYVQSVGVVALGVIVFYVSKSIVFAIVVTAVGSFVTPFVFHLIKQRRLQRFNDQLPDVLNIMASGARAGMNLAQVIRLVAESASSPVREEFTLMVSAMDLGASVEDALRRSRNRLRLPNFRLVTTAILINREKGGDLTELLTRTASSIREISRLEKKIETETASIRLSAKIMAGMPVFFAIVLYFMDPPSMKALFDTLVGNLLLVAVVGLTATGYLMIRKLANPDI